MGTGLTRTVGRLPPSLLRGYSKGASSGLLLLASTTRLAIANSICGLPSEVLFSPVWEHGVQFSGDLRSVFVQQGSGSSLPIHRSAHKQDFQIPRSTTRGALILQCLITVC